MTPLTDINGSKFAVSDLVEKSLFATTDYFRMAQDSRYSARQRRREPMLVLASHQHPAQPNCHHQRPVARVESPGLAAGRNVLCFEPF